MIFDRLGLTIYVALVFSRKDNTLNTQKKKSDRVRNRRDLAFFPEGCVWLKEKIFIRDLAFQAAQLGNF